MNYFTQGFVTQISDPIIYHCGDVSSSHAGQPKIYRQLGKCARR